MITVIIDGQRTLILLKINKKSVNIYVVNHIKEDTILAVHTDVSVLSRRTTNTKDRIIEVGVRT